MAEERETREQLRDELARLRLRLTELEADARSDSGEAPISDDGRPERTERESLPRSVAENERAARLHLERMKTLVRVSRRVLAETAMDGLLKQIADAARQLTGARIGMTGHGYRNGTFQISASSFGEAGYPGPPGKIFKMERGGVYLDLVQGTTSIRLTDEELRRHPAWWGLPTGHGELRGLLGASLSGLDGQSGGLIMVSDRERGDFTAEDEALLIQLAAVASLGLHHIQAREELKGRAEEGERLLAEVASQHHLLQSVLDNMVDGVYVCDPDGCINLVNEPGVSLLGLDSREEVLVPLPELIDKLQLCHLDGTAKRPDELPLHRALRGETLTLVDGLFLNARTGREMSIRSSASPIRNESGRISGAVEVVRDITELKEFERQKEQFIAVAAHELKTPVAIMKGYAQALIRKADDVPPERRRMVEALERGADRIDRIVEELLDISRLHGGHLQLQFERIELPELVIQVADGVAMSNPGHPLRVDTSGPLSIRGDRERLEQVMVSLIDNAIRYSPGGGSVKIAVRENGNAAVVSITDQGVGIPIEQQPRVFERFYRAHSGTPHDYGGMGVALYISREIIQRHGGLMWFESKEGHGSTFHFSLPLEEPDD